MALPPGAARHVQVLRLQPGGAITLFDGLGGEWAAQITRMGRSEVEVEVGEHDPSEREAPRTVRLATGMMALCAIVMFLIAPRWWMAAIGSAIMACVALWLWRRPEPRR